MIYIHISNIEYIPSCRPCEGCKDEACNTEYDDCQNGCSEGWFPSSYDGSCSNRCGSGCLTDRCDR